MNRPIIGILDVQTGEEVIREMTDEEYAQHLIDAAEYEASQAEAESLDNASE